MVKFCSMHVCNLGLVHTASGGALTLASSISLSHRVHACLLCGCGSICYPREALIAAGTFGDPNVLSMKDLLARAFDGFSTWRRQNRIPCSQKPFAERHLVKLAHGFYFTAKAYNARIVLQWLAEMCSIAAVGAPPGSKIPLHAQALNLCSSRFAPYPAKKTV